ncbi:MAG: putative toxin-antitoxin system toxin component, PIN family [Planctomycetes bacterium]|nr:putative toxin-antitoxin system toxin component, PIN family [Planctomycetota bacterium]
MPEQVVLDTNVLVAGLRSTRGASHKILRWIGTGRFGTHVSVPLVLEYEEVLLRESPVLGLSPADVRDFLDYICSVSEHHAIDFLWRPLLRDPHDDMVLELAVQAGCGSIVTHNIRDFAGAGSLGVHAILPRTFLNRIGGKP